MVKLILIRHGQSLWNAENKFTGWADSALSSKGKIEAKQAGIFLKNKNIEVCFTSMLTRAINTLEILLKELENNEIKTIKAWELNERHYGSLTGLNKAETKKKLGDSMFLNYRRSWDIAPPKIDTDSPYLKNFSELNNLIPNNKIPRTESLKDTYNRVINYYNDNILSFIKNNKIVLIAAHGNSLRALCKYLFNISNEKINKLEIPTGNPMIIDFSYSLEVQDAYYMNEKRAMPIFDI